MVYQWQGVLDLTLRDKVYNVLCIENYRIFVSCVSNVLTLGKPQSLIIRLNDQYLNIMGKYQF